MSLVIITFLPLLGALFLMFVPRQEEELQRGIGLATAILTFCASLRLLFGFDPAVYNHVFDRTWVDTLGIHFHLGVDGISLWLVLLTTFLMPVVFLSTYNSINKKVREFMIAALILETGMLGSFLALDLFVFYVFWEILLIPMYFIIGIWGGENRIKASIKFVLYTLVGSLLMLVAIIYLYVKGHDATGVWTFDYFALSKVLLTPRAELLCFLAFGLAFAIKVPMFPLHTWLPDAHTEAPTAGSVILAAVMLKFGTYGLLRFAMPMFPHAMAMCSPYLACLGAVGIVYASLVAFAQDDIKKMIAYSSVAHLAFVVLGLSMFTQKAVDGAMYVMLAHGISTGGLFLCIGALYDRRHTRKISEFGGIAQVMPVFTAIFMVMTFASIGLPGLSGFAGEFLVLIGTFTSGGMSGAAPVLHHVADTTWLIFAPFAWVVHHMKWWALSAMYALGVHPKVLVVVASTGVILSAVYMLYLFQKVMFGPLSNARNRVLEDLSTREIVVFVPMVVMALWLGISPNTFLSSIDPAVQRTVAEFNAKRSQVNPQDGAKVVGAEPNPQHAAIALPNRIMVAK